MNLENAAKTRGDRILLPRRISSGSGVPIQIQPSDPDDFQNLTGTSSSKDTSVIKLSKTPTTLSGDICQLVEKCPISQC